MNFEALFYDLKGQLNLRLYFVPVKVMAECKIIGTEKGKENFCIRKNREAKKQPTQNRTRRHLALTHQNERSIAELLFHTKLVQIN